MFSIFLLLQIKTYNLEVGIITSNSASKVQNVGQKTNSNNSIIETYNKYEIYLQVKSVNTT